MRRDWDTIRSLLVAIQDGRRAFALHPADPGDDKLDAHLTLLVERGLVRPRDRSPARDDANGQGFVEWKGLELSWQGHNAAELARLDRRWGKIVGDIKERALPDAPSFVKQFSNFLFWALIR